MRLLLKNVAFTLLIPGTVAYYVPLWIADGGAGGATPGAVLREVVAALLLLVGTAIYLWCLWDFAVVGRGTPSPLDAPGKLVARGLYHHVRNPMYVGVLTVILGWALFFGDIRLLGYAFGVGAAFHLFVVLVEEPMLRRQFGDGYLQYCEAVGRWFPRRRRKRAV